MIAKESSKHPISKEGLIKYDKCQMKLNLILTVIFGILTVFSWILVLGESNVLEDATDFAYVVIFFFYVCSGPAFIYTIYQLLSGMSYMYRLKKHGYEVPKDKRQYDSSLEKLPHQQIADDVATKVKGRNKSSFSLGIVSLGALVILWVCNILYVVEWSFFYEEIGFMIGFMSVIDIALLVYCVMFFRQANEARYKDDVEIDKSRKNRIPPVEGVLTIFILLSFSVFAKYEAHTLTDYLFKSRVSTDMVLVQSMEQAFDSTYESLEEMDGNVTEMLSANGLMDGVDITTWGVPSNTFQSEVASMLGVSDFLELKDDFYTVEGEAIVYVKWENERFVIELPNQVEKAKNSDDWMWIK